MFKRAVRTAIARRLERQVQSLIKDKNLLVVAVTGSVGKTSTKLAIAAVLRQKYRVLAHEGNYNSEIGLPLSIFELEVPSNLASPIAWSKIFATIRSRSKTYPYDVLVLEMGADQPGDIGKFMRYITPDIGIITAIAPAHTEQFGSVEAILAEKFKLALGSKFVLLNADDPRLMARSVEVSDKLATFGTNGEYGWDNLDLAKRRGSLHLASGQMIEIVLQVIAQHSAQALVVAAAAGDKLGLASAQIATGISHVKPFKGRMNPLVGQKGSLIIDDTYNSSPAAALAALSTLKDYYGSNIAIMGSMNELGENSPEGHREVGAACRGIDWLITIGSDANEYLAPAALGVGMAPEHVKTFDSPYAAGQFVQTLLGKNVTVLAKGSQNRVFAEEAVKQLLNDPNDVNQLVRQSDDWLNTKRQQFSDDDQDS